ncbi:ATP-binding protein [Rubrivivax sp. RP6-9]|uniref:ATP-binding protein n=1 Tax=Rubrivivax sp. RP6-9 TaxID=3415750 RepID=UPI003CC63BF2
MTPVAPAIVGRDDTIAAVAGRIAEHRIVTLVGVGGIGKTTVARAAAARMAASFPHGIAFVDLARLSSPAHLPSALVAALGIAADPGSDPASVQQALATGLRERHPLVLLDNCEPMIDAAASVAHAVLASSEARILATSREPLGVAGEALHRLGGLPYPPPARRAGAADQKAYAAVALFVQRAGLEAPTDDDLAAIGEICRQLDGIPLAIELAAAHVAALGVRGLLAQLGARMLSLEASEGRPAATRHHTLQATLAWSHALLTADEQRALQRLAVFRGPFRLADALRVVVGGTLAEPRALQALQGLAAKSLLAVDRWPNDTMYRLLETTRAFAQQHLAAAGDRAAVLLRHARACIGSLHDAEPAWSTSAEPRAWIAEHGHLIDDVRVAFDWATADAAEPALAAELLLAALPLAGRLALTREMVGKLRSVLALEPVSAWASPRTEFRLWSALGELLCMCDAHEEGSHAYARAHRLAEQLDSAEDRSSAWVGLWTAAHFSGRYRDMELAARALAEQAPDAGTELFALRGTAFALHYLGDHAGASQAARRALAHPLVNAPASHVLHTMIDREVAMRMILARTQWLCGFPDQAREIAAEAVERALKDRATALGVALSIAACPIALWCGDDVAAARMVQRLLRPEAVQARLYGVQWGLRFERVLERRRARGPEAAAAKPDRAGQPHVDPVEADMLATLDAGLLTPLALERVLLGRVGWCAPEILRTAAEQELRSAPHARAGARAGIERALALARFQGALSWELRAATSLATLDAGSDRQARAGAALEQVYARFTEGHGTADLVAARRLLDQLL